MARLRDWRFHARLTEARAAGRPWNDPPPREKPSAQKRRQDYQPPDARRRGQEGQPERNVVVRKLKSGGYRLYSRKINPSTGRRRNLGTFETLQAAMRHERQLQFFKRRH
jgi:hypothetical protein